MKPTINNFATWISEIRNNKYLLQKKYEEIDIEALDEAFKIFMGVKDEDINMSMFKDYKEFKNKFYSNEIKKMHTNNFNEWLKRGRLGLEYRKKIIGYSCNGHFRVKSIRTDLKDYTFTIWHELNNTQIIIDKKNSLEHLRLEWDGLFRAIFDFYSKREQQLNLFGEIVK